MTLVKDALSRAARLCSVTPPTSWLAATADEHVELRDDFLVQTIDDILDRVDLPSPIGSTLTLSGTGGTYYSLGPLFRRLQRGSQSVYETRGVRRSLIPVTSDGEWIDLQEFGAGNGCRYYRISGFPGNHEIEFFPVLAEGDTVRVSIINDLRFAAGPSTFKGDFTKDTDALILPRDMIEAGIVYRFRERRGLPYSDQALAYEALIARHINDARGVRSIHFGGRMVNPLREPPVPDYIPNA